LLKAKAKGKDLTLKAKAKAKDSKFVLEDISRPRTKAKDNNTDQNYARLRNKGAGYVTDATCLRMRQ